MLGDKADSGPELEAPGTCRRGREGDEWIQDATVLAWHIAAAAR